MIARVKERVDKNETEDNGKSKEPKHVTRGDVMQGVQCFLPNKPLLANMRSYQFIVLSSRFDCLVIF